MFFLSHDDSRASYGGDPERSRGTPPGWLTPQEHSRDDAVLHGERGSHLPGVPRRCYRAVEAHSSGINDVVFERDGVLLVTAGDDSFVKVWEPASGVQKAALKVIEGSRMCDLHLIR